MTRGKALHRFLVARGWLVESKGATIGTHVIVFGRGDTEPRTCLHSFIGLSAREPDHIHVFDLKSIEPGHGHGTRLVDDMLAWSRTAGVRGLAFADASDGADEPCGGFWHAYARKHAGEVNLTKVAGCMTCRLEVV